MIITVIGLLLVVANALIIVSTVGRETLTELFQTLKKRFQISNEQLLYQTGAGHNDTATK